MVFCLTRIINKIKRYFIAAKFVIDLFSFNLILHIKLLVPVNKRFESLAYFFKCHHNGTHCIDTQCINTLLNSSMHISLYAGFLSVSVTFYVLRLNNSQLFYPIWRYLVRSIKIKVRKMQRNVRSNSIKVHKMQ